VSLARALDRLDQWQRRSPPVGFVVAVVKKFLDDRGPNLGVQMAYWAFFSVFSLLLAFVAILGFVFHGDPSFQQDVRDSALEQMPVIGPQISASVGSLTGSTAALVIGIVAALWTGLGFTLTTGDALDRLWAVPRIDRPGFLSSRVRGLLLLASVGSITVASTALVGLATEAQIQPALVEVATIIVSAAIDFLIFVACFRLLTSAPVTTRSVLPGAAVAAIAWQALQAVGAIYVSQVVKGSSQTYGGFAVVVGLLSWLFLGAQVTLLSAEANVVLERRLWPRSISGSLEPADRHALRNAAVAEQCDPRERIAVTFEPASGTSRADAIDPAQADVPD
jgi:membrane protein